MTLFCLPLPFSQTAFSLILRGMHRARRTCWSLSLLLMAGMLWSNWPAPLWAQWGGMVSSHQFDLGDTVQLDQVDNAVLIQFERAKALLADRQWDEAVEILRQLAASSDEKLLGVTSHRYVSLRQWCQLQLAALPPEALKLYRARVDPVAREWCQQGIAARDRRLLQNVVEQAFASSYGDDALLALGDMALESGDYAAARWDWERIVPSAPPVEKKGTGPISRNGAEGASQKSDLSPFSPGCLRTWPGYPDTNLDLAAVRARLVLVSILETGEKGSGPICRNGPAGASRNLDLTPFPHEASTSRAGRNSWNSRVSTRTHEDGWAVEKGNTPNF